MLEIDSGLQEAMQHNPALYKHIRVRFPFSGRLDIVGSQIETESLSFDESLCSQQFKFGLAEQSCIKFTAIGIDNIKGETIDVILEVEWECDDSHFDEALGKYLVDIPLGRFTVESCRRSNVGIDKREVVAYSVEDFNRFLNNPVYWYLSNSRCWANNQDLCMCTEVIEKSFFGIKDVPDSEKGYISFSYNYGDLTTKKRYYVGRNGDYAYYIDVEYKGFSLADSAKNRTATTARRIGAQFLEFPTNYLQVKYPYYVESEFEYFNKQLAKEGINIDVTKLICPMIVEVIPYDWGIVDDKGFCRKTEYMLNNPTEPLELCMMYERYRYTSGSSTVSRWYSSDVQVYRPITMSLIEIDVVDYPDDEYVWVGPVDLTVDTNQIIHNDIDVVSYLSDGNDWTRSKSWGGDTLGTTQGSPIFKLPRKKKDKHILPNGTYRTDYVTENNVFNKDNIRNILEGILEMNASFGKFDRYGKFKMIQLNNNDEAISIKSISELWVDDYYIATPTNSQITYTDTNNQVQVFEVPGFIPSSYPDADKLVKYDLSNNYLVKNLPWSEGIASSGTFAGYMLDIRRIALIFDDKVSKFNFDTYYYMPFECECVGLPFLEAGDRIKIKSRDGYIDSFILQRKLNGIQFLWDTIESN